MTDALIHRGPDAQEVLRLDGCELGHTRLSVIDLCTGRQPMTDPSRSIHHRLQRRDLQLSRAARAGLHQEDISSAQNSDTEVLLHACIEYGPSAPLHLNGQFAFAFWNARQRSLLAARDRFGEKPLYWARGSCGELLIASEIKAILASELIEPRIDPLSVDAYLGLHYVPPDRTIYDNIHNPFPRLTSGCGKIVDSSPRATGPRPSARVISNPLKPWKRSRALLARAVQRQMAADVPVGAFLSGGLDSTTIVAQMQPYSTSPVSTFSVGFGDLIDELPFARDAARRYETDHHELQMDIDVAEMLHRMARVYDEPFADSSNIPTYLMAEYASRHVKVALSGDGADELFGGYEWYRPLLDPTADHDTLHQHLSRSTHVLADRAALWGGVQAEIQRIDRLDVSHESARDRCSRLLRLPLLSRRRHPGQSRPGGDGPRTGNTRAVSRWRSRGVRAGPPFTAPLQ